MVSRTVSRSAIGGFWRLLQQQLGELLGRVGEVEALAGAVVEFVGDGVELRLADGGEVGALGEVWAQQAVGVLVGTALPRGVRIAEEDLDAGVDVDLLPVALKGAKTLIRRAAPAWPALRGSCDGLVVRLPGVRCAAEVAASQPARRGQGH
jgi:hypothetical protein